MKKKHWKIIASALAASTAVSIFFLFGFFSTWSAKLTDKLFLPSKPNPSIVIIAIDNESLQKIGRWPWDRKVHAQLIDKLREQKPAVIGLDVNFPERSDADSDKALAEAIKKAGNVILPIEANLKISKDRIIAEKPLFSIPEIREAAAGAGITNTPADDDGVFRKLPIEIYTNQPDGRFAAFSHLIANQYFLKNKQYLKQIPEDSKGRMIVNFAGRPGTITTIPAIKVMSGELETGRLENKIVLIGATASDLHDEILTPVSRLGALMSGVEVHANCLQTILSGRFLRPIGKIWQILILFATALVLGAVLVLSRIRNSSISAFLILVVYIIAALVAFDFGIILDLFYFILTVLSVYLTAVSLKYLLETKEKKYIKSTFGLYVSEQIVNELMESPDKLKLGGEKKELSILFSDIRGFTSISEKLNPEKLVSLLNRYLTAMADTIMESEGVIDKFIGDAIMAFWGAPIGNPEHARKSCLAALKMIQQLNARKEDWQKEFGVDLNIGIGINTGEAVVGNLGSDKRFDYTVIGDSVNLASRLESLTKQYGVRIIVSEFTKNVAGDEFLYRPLDLVVVKGKKEAVLIYELIDKKSEVNEQTKEYTARFSEGIASYREQQWDKAFAVFSKLKDERPDDAVCDLYLGRIGELKNNPPDAGWDGVYHLTSK